MSPRQKIHLGLLIGARSNPIGVLILLCLPLLPLLAIVGIVLSLLSSIGCMDPRAQESRIVREVEWAGAGNLNMYDVVSLQQWFSVRPAMATRIASECVDRAKHSDAAWARSAEGATCIAATAMAPPPPPIADQRGW